MAWLSCLTGRARRRREKCPFKLRWGCLWNIPVRLQASLLRQTHFSILEIYPIVSCCKIKHDKILLNNIANFPSKCCVNNSTIQFIQSEIPFQLFVIFQAHRDEVITMVANPVVDQVISAGLGESKPSLCFVNNFENIHCQKSTRGIYCSRK